MSLIARIQRGVTPTPPRLLVYGTEGIGKSTFGSQAPSPIFLQTEDGLDQIACDKFPLAKSLDEVFAAIKDLRTEPHDYESFVLDSADWLERLIWDRVCQESGVTSIEKADGGYAKGYAHALSIWRGLVEEMERLRAERHMMILLIAHSKVERFEDPESTAYDRYSPRLHKLASAFLCEWCDAVLFATRRMRTQTEDGGFNKKRTVAQPIGKSGGERILRCVGSPACVAKNRFGITDDLPLSWPAFMEAMSQQQGGTANG